MELPQLPAYVFDLHTGAGVLSALLTLVLPLLTALLVRQSWPSGVKGVTLLALSAVKVLLVGWYAAAVDGAVFDLAGAGTGVAVNFVVAVAVYFGLWRGTGVQRSALNSGNVDPR